MVEFTSLIAPFNSATSEPIDIVGDGGSVGPGPEVGVGVPLGVGVAVGVGVGVLEGVGVGVADGVGVGPPPGSVVNDATSEQFELLSTSAPQPRTV
jgi:hypothetical protein